MNRSMFKHCFNLLTMLALCACVAPAARAELNQVSLAEWDAFALDVDGDGEADFEGSLSDEQNIALLSRFDTSLAVNTFPGLLPGQGAGGSSNQFGSLDELRANDLFSGDVAPVHPLFGDLHLGTTVVVLNANKRKPIWAGWRFGTSGEGNDPFEVIGFVLDASAFFESGGADPIALYTRHYGTVALGEVLTGLSLAAALGESPSPGGGGGPATPVAAQAAFDGPWSGSLTVPSTVGRHYALRRSLDLVESTIEEAQAGTGDPLVFRFDDAAAPAQRAFFWVEETVGP